VALPETPYVEFGAKHSAVSRTRESISLSTQLSLGEYVRRLRRAKEWDLQRLGAETDLSVSHLSRIENDRAIPNADSVIRLARALDGDLGLMLELANHLPREMLARLIRRAEGRAMAHRRSAGVEADPTFAGAMVEDMDLNLRFALAQLLHLSDSDEEGFFLALGRMAAMEPAELEQVFDFVEFLVSKRRERQ
jgi:transcriptional regulator with XRE-family HTH domain